MLDALIGEPATLGDFLNLVRVALTIAFIALVGVVGLYFRARAWERHQLKAAQHARNAADYAVQAGMAADATAKECHAQAAADHVKSERGLVRLKALMDSFDDSEETRAFGELPLPKSCRYRKPIGNGGPP